MRVVMLRVGARVSLSVGALVAVMVSVVLTVLVAPPVGAAESLAPTVVVLDASGSMTETDVDGRTRMDAAKDATKDFLNQAPADAKFGLVTYGTGTGSSEEEKEAGCQDISVLAKPGERPPKELTGDVDGLQPRGYTPIGNSLLKANELLPKEGARSIVLVSDGIDTCAPPPVCEVAKQLKDRGTDLVVHTIGFMVDDAARAELECVAKVTGGTYSDASSAEALRETLTKATTRTAVGYQFSDEVVQFSADKSHAPMIEPGTLDKPKRIHAKMPVEDSENIYAKVSIPEGHRLHVGFNAVPELGTARLLEKKFTYYPELTNPKGLSCRAESTGASTIDGGRPVFGSFISGVQGSDNFCDGDFYFLTLNETWEGPQDVDMMLAAVPEPIDVGDDFNKTPSKERKEESLSEPADTSQVTPYTPLTHPDPDAPEVTGTVEAEIVEGETQYFATPVGWGQALDITTEIIEDPIEGKVDSFEKISRRLEVYAGNGLMQSQSDSILTGEYQTRIEEIGKKNVAGTKYPISYANIEKNNPLWLGGRHYVQVSFISTHREDGNTDATTELHPVKYRINFRPVGKEVPGPKFESTYSGEKTTQSATNEATSEAQPSAEQKSGMSMVWWIVAAVAIVVLAGAIFVLAKLTQGPKA